MDNQKRYWQFEVFGTDPHAIGFFGTAGIILPSGTTAERPTVPVEGHVRLNTDSVELEAFYGGLWQGLGTGGGGGTFIGLTDTPGSYAGAANQAMRINSAETDVEFTDSLIIENSGRLRVTSATYNTLVTTDATITNKKYVDDQDALQLSLSGGTMTGSFSAGGFAITGLPLTPTGASEAASKSYVDSVSAGLDPKESVRVATTVAGTLASSFENGDTIDGIILATGDRILIKNQADPKENGIYTVNASGAPTRATDQDGTPAAEVSGGNFTFVEVGTVNEGTGWVVLGDGILTIGVDDIDWTQFSGGGGAFLPLAGGSMSGDIVLSAPGVQISGSSSDTAGTPSYSWTGDLDTGVYHAGVDTIGFSTAGTGRWTVNSAGHFVPVISVTYDIGLSGLKVRDVYADHFKPNLGAAGDPSYSFEGDTNTGMFSAGADEINFAVGGTSVFNIESDGTLSVNTASYETLVTADNDVPNKKYVDDLVGSGAFYTTVGGDSGTATATTPGETINLIGETLGGITTTAGDAPDQVAFGLTPIDLATGAATLAAGDFIIVSDSADIATTLAQKYTFSDMITDLGILTSGGQVVFTSVTGDTGTATADSNSDSIALVGDTSGGITTTATDGPEQVAFGLTPIDLATGAATLALGDFVIVSDSGDASTVLAQKYTFTDIVEDLDIPNAISVNGFVARTAADTYASRTITVAGAGASDGLDITNGDGVSGDPVIGLDIDGSPLAGEDAAAGDLFLLYNSSASANETFTLAEVANGVAAVGFSSLSDTDGDTQIQVEESPDEDIIRFDTGDSPAGYGAVPNIMTLASSGWTVAMGTADAGTVGAPISITSGISPDTGGGDISVITGGTTGLFGGGGNITLTTADGGVVSGDGGDITVDAGTGGGAGNGGNITLGGGAGGGGGTGNGGSVTITAGESGSPTSSIAGNITISTPNAINDNVSGTGSITISTGDGTTNAADVGSGPITISTGDAHGSSGSGGAITIISGDGSDDANGRGGDISLTAGAAGSTGSASSTSGGSINLTAGDTTNVGNDRAGGIRITAGTATTKGAGGLVAISAGAGGGGVNSGSGGSVSVAAGKGGTTANGGDVTITGGDGGTSSGNGGSINLNAGNHDGSGAGGAINLTAGNSNRTDPGGAVNITAGTGGINAGGDGGLVVVTAGSAGVASAGDGGDIELRPGAADGAGADGTVRIIGSTAAGELRFEDNAGGDYVGFKAPAVVTASYTLAFPAADAAGALTSDGAGNLSFTSAGASDEIVDVDGDTRIQVEESPDEDIIRFDTGDSPAGYGAVPNIMTLASSGWTVAMGTADAATVGAPISLTTGTGNTTGAGGSFSVTTGKGGATGDGGAIDLTAGDGGATSGDGGIVTISGGNADGGGSGGDVNVNAGTGASPGGNVNITAGASTGTDAGGSINLTAATGGGGVAGDGGAVVITAGSAGSGSLADGGDIELRPGALDGTGIDGVVRIIGPTPGPGTIEIQDAAGGESVTIAAPTTVTASHTMTLPTAVATIAGAGLVSDTSGNLSFTSFPVTVTPGIFAQNNTTATLSEQFTHNLGTTDILILAKDLTTSPPMMFLPTIEIDDANNITVTLGSPAGGANEYRIIVHG